MIQMIETGRAIYHEDGVADLIRQMMDGKIEEINPVIDMSRDSGISYPQVETMLSKPPAEVSNILASLAAENVLEEQFYDRLIFCPACNSMNLRPSIKCPKCTSGKITRGRIIEHMVCGNNGLEEEFIFRGKYMCPRCHKPLKFLGSDYLSLGINYKCLNCGMLSHEVELKWQCLKCSASFLDEEAKVLIANSYVFNEESRARIAFDMGLKPRFIDYLKLQGYEIFEMAKYTSESGSGVAHMLDILARRSDGFLTFLIGIGVVIGKDNDNVGLEDVFRFDNKVYDLGIHDKVILAIPSISSEARQFARRQRIKTFDTHELEEFLDGSGSHRPHPVVDIPFKYESKSKLLEHLHKQGYRTEEMARIPGRSGAEYVIDIIAYFDDGLFIHTISIGILRDEKDISLEAVSAYDTKAYDIGIHDKILLVCPALSVEAQQFAEQQNIKVIEFRDVAALV